MQDGNLLLCMKPTSLKPYTVAANVDTTINDLVAIHMDWSVLLLGAKDYMVATH